MGSFHNILLQSLTEYPKVHPEIETPNGLALPFILLIFLTASLIAMGYN